MVLGGGISGISAAYHASGLGLKSVVYEASNKLGGLVSNFEVEGFRFDNAIHLSFTKDEYVRSIFDKVDYHTHKPNAYCYDSGLWLKHPIQNNLFQLPVDEKVKLISSFFDRPNDEPKNYKEWLYSQYGSEISEQYPIAYTRKYWGQEPENLSLTWIGNRLRRADAEEVLKGAFENRDDNHYYAAEMRYPQKGGYYSFISELTQDLSVQYNKQAVRIDPKLNKVYFSDGSVASYDRLVNTIPIPSLISILDEVPDNVVKAAASLRWTTVDLISIGFDKNNVPPYLWFYIYGDKNLAARGYSPSWKSSDNAPEGCSSLQFEIYNLDTAPKFDTDELKANILQGLVDMGICSKGDPLFLHHKHLPFGNVVFDLGMEERRQIVRDYLSSIDIVCAGRFGEWDYLWSDQSFLSGRSSVEGFK